MELLVKADKKSRTIHSFFLQEQRQLNKRIQDNNSTINGKKNICTAHIYKEWNTRIIRKKNNNKRNERKEKRTKKQQHFTS